MSYRTISEIQRDAKESEARFNAQRALEDAERRVFRERSRELELKMAQDESTFKIIFIVFTVLAVLLILIAVIAASVMIMRRKKRDAAIAASGAGADGAQYARYGAYGQQPPVFPQHKDAQSHQNMPQPTYASSPNYETYRDAPPAYHQ